MIGTQATVASRAYDRAMAATRADVILHSQACPVFVEHVERGDTTSRRATEGRARVSFTADEGGHRHADPGLHALSAAVRAAPARAGARRGAGVLGRGDREGRVRHAAATTACESTEPSRPTHAFLATGDPAAFQRVAEVFLGPELGRGASRAGPAGGRWFVELTVLGTSGTWPRAGGATCGYLLSHDGRNIWLDAGTGTFARLQEHIDVDDARRHRDHATAMPITSST